MLFWINKNHNLYHFDCLIDSYRKAYRLQCANMNSRSTIDFEEWLSDRVIV